MKITSEQTQVIDSKTIKPKVTAFIGFHESENLVNQEVEPSMLVGNSGNGEWEYKIDLDRESVVKSIVIFWPSGIEQTIFEPAINESIIVMHDSLNL